MRLSGLNVMTSRFLALCMACLLFSACSVTLPPERPEVFAHSVEGETRPWSHENFESSNDKFSFLVFSDLTGGEREGIYAIAVEQMNLLRPDLIVNVGDLIEGAEDRAELDRQWDSFDERTGKAKAPVFYTGGNHDLLGVEMRRAWENRLGDRYYHFIYHNVLFLVLDTEDYSSERLREVEQMRVSAIRVAEEQGWDAFAETPYATMPEDETGTISARQSEAMVRAIQDNPDVRWIFLLIHKAAWRAGGAAGWDAIEAALGDRPHTVFHGHRHGYQHERRGSGDYIRLATTGGVQLPDRGRSMDHMVLVTVDDDGAHIANLLMSGILDKTGRIPLNGDDRCFEAALCDKPLQ